MRESKKISNKKNHPLITPVQLTDFALRLDLKYKFNTIDEALNEAIRWVLKSQERLNDLLSLNPDLQKAFEIEKTIVKKQRAQASLIFSILHFITPEDLMEEWQKQTSKSKNSKDKSIRKPAILGKYQQRLFNEQPQKTEAEIEKIQKDVEAENGKDEKKVKATVISYLVKEIIKLRKKDRGRKTKSTPDKAD